MTGGPGGGPLSAGRIKRVAMTGGIGILVGIGLGALLDNIGMGFALGLFIGLLIGVSGGKK